MKKAADSGGPLGSAAQLGTTITDMQKHITGLQQNLQGVDGIKAIRGLGLMLAVELDRPCKEIMSMALAQGLLVNVTADRVVRLLPPLILTDSEADRVATGVAGVVREFLRRAVA